MRTKILFILSLLFCAYHLRAQGYVLYTLETFTCETDSGSFMGYQEEDGKVVVPCIYDRLSEYSKGIGIGKYKGKFCIVMTHGERMLEGKYDEIYRCETLDLLAAVRKGKYWGFIDMDFKEVIPCEYELDDTWELRLDGQCYLDSTSVMCVKKDGKYGVLRPHTGKIIVPFLYDALQSQEYPTVFAARSKGKWTLLDSAGKPYFKPVYSEYGGEVKGRYEAFKKGKAWVFIDKYDGREYTSIREKISDPENHSRAQGILTIQKEKKYAYINADGKQLTDFDYDRANDFTDDPLTAAVQMNGHIGLIDTNGKFLVKPEYERLESQDLFGFTRIMKNGKWGVLNKKLEMVVQPTYEDIGSYFCGGINEVYKDEKWGAIDTTGKVVLPLIYEGVHFHCYDSLFAFTVCKTVNGKTAWGIVDKQGKTVLDFTYKEIGQFAEGLAYVYLDGKYGFIDTKGKVVIPLEFDELKTDRFYQDRITVKQNGNWKDIGKDGMIK